MLAIYKPPMHFFAIEITLDWVLEEGCMKSHFYLDPSHKLAKQALTNTEVKIDYMVDR